ncbi:MAG: molybdopterin molybdotransferase MoeA, partial [Chloroflexi bacterium]|nr:molybdopterin molybdotransferase MoeA [Chloroflexota bacterium]
TLAALAQKAGCDVVRLGVASDRREAVEEMLDQAANLQPGVIISSAGVRVGAFDFIKDVVESAGSLNFWKVNMRPGKPLAFGSYRNIPFFGLPGNPVSSFVGFLIFVQPALERLGGVETAEKAKVKVVLSEGIESDGRESYLRAIVKRQNGSFIASLTGHQGSGNLFSLVQANALLIIPSGVKSCPPGSEVEAWILEN